MLDAIPVRLGMSGRRARSLCTVLIGLVVPAVASAQQPRPDSHTVRPGDTLWDLAQLYLNDPFLWPEIYRLNTDVVEDPHWIYPGEILRLAATPGLSAVPQTDTPVPSADSAQVAAGDSLAAADSTAMADSGLVAGGAQAVSVADDNEGGPEEADMTPLFGRRRQPEAPTLERLNSAAYRSIRPSEFFSSGFLSEGEHLPLGKLLGPTEPPQISSIGARATAHIYGQVRVTPPSDAKYQTGDTLLIVRLDRDIEHYGDVIVPTGLVRVVDVSLPETVAEVVAEYGAIRAGQSVLPAERFKDPGSARPVPISDGVEGEVIDSRDPQELKGPQDIVFINRGRKDGVGIGDMFEIRRLAERLPDGTMAVPEVMATMQVVHVRERTATARLVRVLSPDIRPGAHVKQVSKLPS